MAPDNHKQFDEESLMRRKESFGGYKYCPFCSGKLFEQNLNGIPRIVCRRSGCDFIYYHNPTPAAGAIVIKNDKLLLVKRAHPPKVDWWCLPAGFMEWHEHPRDTAKREVEEETGLIIKLISLFNVYTGIDDPRTNAVLILYLAEEAGGEAKASDDASDVGYFDFDKLPDKIAFVAHRKAIADYLKSTDNPQ